MKGLPVLAGLVFLTAFQLCARAGDLPAGTSTGTFIPEDKPAVTLANAAAFVDTKEEGAPVLLMLSDKKVVVGDWKSEIDMMMAHPMFSGAIFFIDKEGTVFRTDVYDKGQQSSVSGYFNLKLDGAMSKDLKGEVKSSETSSKGPKLDAVFHAVVK